MKAKIFGVGVFIVVGVVLTWIFSEPIESQLPHAEINNTATLSVSAVDVIPSTMSNTIKAVGISKARWELNVTSPVSGKIKILPSEIEPNVKVTKNTLLASIVDTSFQSDHVMAKARVAQAELELSRYKHEQFVAKQVNGLRKANAYGNFEPHIKSAEAELAATRIQVKYAKERLADTVISAPYNAIILEKNLTPSQWVNEGDVVLKIAATDSIDINVELSDIVWQRLGKINANTQVNIEAPSGKTWSATVRYINPILNKQTRQRSLVLQVLQPYSGDLPLMPEQQVKVIFKGKVQANIVQAPSTALTHDSKVWTIIDDKLVMESVEIIEEQPDIVSIRFLTSASQPRALVLFPLNSMLIGQKVTINNVVIEDI